MTCFLLAEFIGGPRDGETMVLVGTADRLREIRVLLGKPLACAQRDAAMDVPLRVGRYVLREGVEFWLTERLASASRVEVEQVVRSSAPPSLYDWEGE